MNARLLKFDLRTIHRVTVFGNVHIHNVPDRTRVSDAARMGTSLPAFGGIGCRKSGDVYDERAPQRRVNGPVFFFQLECDEHTGILPCNRLRQFAGSGTRYVQPLDPAVG